MASRPAPRTPGSLLDAGGPLAAEVAGFAPRRGQQEMADMVAAACAHSEDLICEAGTGIGKTFAYLVPLLAEGRRAIVSTATKPLQAQLVNEDIPRVARALGVAPTVALLKGRSNYLCRHRLGTALADPGLPPGALHDLAPVSEWSTRTEHGDVATLAAVPEQAAVWPFVTSTVDNCLGGRCEHYQRCFAVEARLRAFDADIIVVNHHLLLSDLTLKTQGFGELLPEVDVVVVDEAHALIEVVRRTLGFQLSSRQLTDLAHDTRRALTEESSGSAAFDDAFAALGDVLDDLERRLAGAGEGGGPEAFDTMRHERGIEPGLVRLKDLLGEIAGGLDDLAGQGPACANSARRFSEAAARQDIWASAETGEFIRWVEHNRAGFVLRATPFDVAEAFADRRRQIEAPWIYTSATIAVAGRFDHFRETLGIGEAACARWDSPFDFANRGRIYLPEAPCEPRDPAYVEHVAATIEAVAGLCEGRTFALFTSHRALRAAAARLRERLPWRCLVQGEAPREALLAAFVRDGQAVLFGSASFWEGVDVRGSALSAVVIDKLPFPRPDDPIRAARARVLVESGRNPFLEDQLPSAVLALKQGVGRLIRDPNDCGIVAICDPRLERRGYGRQFIESLPPMPVARSFAEVRTFWESVQPPVEA